MRSQNHRPTETVIFFLPTLSLGRKTCYVCFNSKIEIEKCFLFDMSKSEIK